MMQMARDIIKNCKVLISREWLKVSMGSACAIGLAQEDLQVRLEHL